MSAGGASNQEPYMAREKDLDMVLNHLDGMYFQGSGTHRPDLASINALHSSPDYFHGPNASTAPGSPQAPVTFLVSARSRLSVSSAGPRKNALTIRHPSPPTVLEQISAVTIELDASLYPDTPKRSAPRGNQLNTLKSKSAETHRSFGSKSGHPAPILTTESSSSSSLNWSSAPWTVQSRARDGLLDGVFRESTLVDSKPARRVSPASRSHRAKEKKGNESPRLRLQKPDFASAMVMIQAISAQQQQISDVQTLARASIQSLAVLLRHSASSFGGPFCQTLFQGVFKSIYSVDDENCDNTMRSFSNWIADASIESGSIFQLLNLLESLTSYSEKVEIVADTMHDQSRTMVEINKLCNNQQNQIRELSLELANSKQKQADAELNLLAAISQSNSSMVSGEMSHGFVSHSLYQNAIKHSEQLRDDLKELKSAFLNQQILVVEKELAVESCKKTIEDHEESIQALNQSLNDSQMIITSRDLQIEKLRRDYLDEYSRNPNNPSDDIDLIMNSSTWVSKLVRSEDVFDFSYRPRDEITQIAFSQRDQCLGLLISWINKHLENDNVDVHVSNFGRDMSSGIVFEVLFRRCMGNNPYYQQKCNEARVEMDTDSRLKHVADMASTLLHCPISVGSIMAAEPKTMWMIISELFNTNPTLDPCSIANLKVLSSDAIHVVRRQSLGIMLSDSCQTTSSAALFSAVKESMKNVSKAKRGLSDLPHDSIYAHMNPNVVISTLNELSPKWALHKIPVQSLLEAMSKLGGNGCLALCVSIIHRYRSQLSDVFRYYSLLGRESATSLPSLDIGEMEIFLADAQIELDTVIAEKLLRAACEECSPEVPINSIDYALDLVSFLVFLIKVALESGIKLEATDSATEYMVATALTRLVQNHVCSRAIRLVNHNGLFMFEY